MNERKLNIDNIRTSMEKLGLTQTDLSTKVQVSKEAVSKWLKGEKFPRPLKLLELSKQLKLSFHDLVVQEYSNIPIVAFRTNKNKKITKELESLALDMGEVLKLLLPYIDRDFVFTAPIIQNPSLDYEYIQKVALEIRKKTGLNSKEISFSEIMMLYSSFRIIFVPVMWGNNGNNGLYINLPESNITFVYANLEKVITDFKFWLLHELAHSMTPSLSGEESETFADSFAGAVLFPQALAKKAYEEIIKIRNTGTAINRIKELASKYVISPYTIFNEIQNYAIRFSLPELNMEMGGAVTNFNKEVSLVSEIIFQEKNPDAEKYITVCKDVFGSSFFNALEWYLKDKEKEAGVVQRLMNIPIADAKGVYSALVKTKNPA